MAKDKNKDYNYPKYDAGGRVKKEKFQYGGRISPEIDKRIPRQMDTRIRPPGPWIPEIDVPPPVADDDVVPPGFQGGAATGPNIYVPPTPAPRRKRKPPRLGRPMYKKGGKVNK